MEPWMLDREAAWWAKLSRAQTHLDMLSKLVDEFETTKPYTLTREPGDKPNEVAYRLTIQPMAVALRRSHQRYGDWPQNDDISISISAPSFGRYGRG